MSGRIFFEGAQVEETEAVDPHANNPPGTELCRRVTKPSCFLPLPLFHGQATSPIMTQKKGSCAIQSIVFFAVLSIRQRRTGYSLKKPIILVGMREGVGTWCIAWTLGICRPRSTCSTPHTDSPGFSSAGTNRMRVKSGCLDTSVHRRTRASHSPEQSTTTTVICTDIEKPFRNEYTIMRRINQSTIEFSHKDRYTA